MKEVNFKKLTGKNFLSIGNVPIQFDFPSGINIITGYNYDKNDENGVGKTTIVQLFYWTLFGTTLSTLKKNEILNDITGKQCVGTIEFEVIQDGRVKNYKVERGIKPSYCKLIIDGSEEENPPSISVTNKKIESILSSTSLIFKNCIVLSMNNSIPFMAQGKADRKNFIESMFRLEVFRYMEKDARKKYNEFVRNQDINLEKLNLYTNNKETYLLKKEEFENEKKNKIQKLLNRKDDYIKEVNFLKEKNKPVDVDELNSLHDKLNVLQEKNSDKEKKQQQIEFHLNSLEEELNKHQTSKRKFNSDVLEKIKVYDKYLNKKEKVLEKLEEIPNDISSLNEKNSQFRYEIKTLSETLQKIKKYGDICTSCERPFTEDEKKNNKENILEIQNKIDEFNDSIKENDGDIENLKKEKVKFEKFISFIGELTELKELEQNIDEVTSKIQKLKEKIEPIQEEIEKFKNDKNDLEKRILELNEIFQSNKNNEKEIENINKFILSVDGDINEIKKEKNSFSVLIEDNEEHLKKHQDKAKELSKEIEIYDSIKFIVSEEGIKTYIIKKLLGVLNERIAYYLKTLESNATLVFDEFFDDLLQNDKGIEKSYENFSGGERKRIDLACLFAFLDIRRIQGDVRFNVIFFDELLDSAISSKACDLVFKILKERFDLYSESANIITHRKEFKSESKKLIDNTIFLEKRNGFTKIGENNEFKV